MLAEMSQQARGEQPSERADGAPTAPIAQLQRMIGSWWNAVRRAAFQPDIVTAPRRGVRAAQVQPRKTEAG